MNRSLRPLASPALRARTACRRANPRTRAHSISVLLCLLVGGAGVLPAAAQAPPAASALAALAAAALEGGAEAGAARSLAQAVAQVLGEEAKLTASDGAPVDHFGRSVSLSGNRALIGAPYDDDHGFASGSAYVFVFDGTTWSQQAKLRASDGAEFDFFGSSLSLSGDRALVGAFYDDDRGTNSGSVYVFVFDGTTWSQQAKLRASDGVAEDQFGWSVSLSGDRALVGAIYDDDRGFNSGSAYVFRFDGTTWSQQAKLTASDGATEDRFGWSVSLSGDRALVGATDDDDNGRNSGAAYVFVFDGTAWSQQAKLTASDGGEAEYFGSSVSLSGDRALVGAYFDDDDGNGSGSAYVFVFDGTTWSQQAKLTASDGAAYDFFGRSVSLSGDRALVGAYHDDDNGLDSGSAYVFDLDEQGCAQSLTATVSDDTPAPGQTITFNVAVTNNDTSPALLDLWLEAFRNGTAVQRSRLGSGTLPPGATVTRAVPVRIPPGAPPGAYDVNLILGDFEPDAECDVAPFVITVGGAAAGREAARAPFEVEAVAGDLFAPVQEASVTEALPAVFALHAAYPNPFATRVTLRYDLPEASPVRLVVYDVLGREVAVVVNAEREAGAHTAAFDGRGLASGVYVVRLTAGEQVFTQRLTLAR